MTTTMNLIAKQTVGAGGAASVTFSNIPQTYTDLKLVISTRIDVNNPFEQVKLNFNNDTGSNYSSILNLQGYNGSASSSAPTSRTFMYLGYTNANSSTASTFGSLDVYIPNYTSTTAAKSISVDEAQENNSSSNYVLQLNTSIWSPGTQAAINRIDVTPNSGNWMEFSTFYLYGISNSTTTQATTVPYASGGDVITTDGSYWYHAFKYSGSFTPLKNLTADVLVVAGGGGGSAGGAGAGGLLPFLTQALTSATNYTCTVGSGGAGNTSGASAIGGTGSDSQFGALTLVKGGGGAARGASGNNQNGGNGGSGGGGFVGGVGTDPAGLGGSGTSGQGYAGGNSAAAAPSASSTGGGGGAGAVGGTAPSADTAGNGGAGVSTYSSWGIATSTGQLVSSTRWFAGGGGGGIYVNGTAGVGGNGGGGSGASNNNLPTVNGMANTGGGGGGAYSPTYGTAGNGGSGIIIVRYAV